MFCLGGEDQIADQAKELFLVEIKDFIEVV